MGFYVESGKIAEVSVPLSTFEIYYATGETWYGPDELSVKRRAGINVRVRLNFTMTVSITRAGTLELFLQDNGNMEL